METQKTPNSQNSLKKAKTVLRRPKWCIMFPDFKLLQNFNNQNSIVMEQK